jgi:hypothetical protein
LTTAPTRVIIKKKEREVNKMFRVMMLVDGEAYEYGRWADRNKANEVAMEVRAERRIETFVEEI